MLTIAPFVKDSVTVRLKVTSLKGDIAYSSSSTLAVPLAVQRYYLNATGITSSSVLSGLHVTGGRGVLEIESDSVRSLEIYTLDGRLVRRVSVPVGSLRVEGLSPNVYLVEGVKIAVN